MPNQVTAAEIVQALGGEIIGEGTTPIQALAPLDKAGPGDISFLSNAKYQSHLAQSKASCIGLRASDVAFAGSTTPALIVCPNPYLYYARLSQWWAKHQGLIPTEGFVHPSAVINPKAVVHPSAYIGPLCIIEAHARIGAHSLLHARVYVGNRCHIGRRCIVHAGVVIGSDGFGFANSAGQFGGSWVKIEQLGAVHIGDNVEIGANTCIDRGALGNTTIEEGVKIDNLVQIAHNVCIGKHSALAGQSGIAGSTRIGAYCAIGGAGKVAGHIHLTDHVHISGGSSVFRSIDKPGQYTSAYPMQTHKEWQRTAAVLTHLHELRERIRALEKQVQKIQNPNQGTLHNNQESE